MGVAVAVGVGVDAGLPTELVDPPPLLLLLLDTGVLTGVLPGIGVFTTVGAIVGTGVLVGVGVGTTQHPDPAAHSSAPLVQQALVPPSSVVLPPLQVLYPLAQLHAGDEARYPPLGQIETQPPVPVQEISAWLAPQEAGNAGAQVGVLVGVGVRVTVGVSVIVGVTLGVSV